jgi:GT2 family glycosyltransferase
VVTVMVSVVVPTWQRAVWLERCLQGLRHQERLPDEVIVVGRAEDESAKALFDLDRDWTPLNVRWVEIDRPGHIAPLRKALGEATGDVVAFLDDDAEPTPSWLSLLLVPFAQANVANVGGQVRSPWPRAEMKVAGDAGRIRWYGKLPGNVAARTDPEQVEVDGTMECNWAWRHSILRELEFDPVLDYDDAAMYGLDLCLQAKAKGHRVVYQSQASVLHYAAPRASTLDRTDRAARTVAFSRNYTYIALKHFRGFRRMSFVVWWMLIGVRNSYGPLGVLADVLALRPPSREVVVASFRGKLEGFKLWRSRVGTGRAHH